MDTVVVKNKWSSGVRGAILAAVIVIVASVGIGALCMAGAEHDGYLFTKVVLPVILSVTLVVLLLCWPIGIAIGNGRLKLMRPWRSIVIQRGEITDFHKFYRGDTRGVIRIHVGCRYVGYWGWFWNPQAGWLTMHTLGGDDLLLIELRDGKKYVIENCKPVWDFLNSATA